MCVHETGIDLCLVDVFGTGTSRQGYLNKLNRLFFQSLLMCQPFIAVGFGRFCDPHSKVMRRNEERKKKKPKQAYICTHKIVPEVLATSLLIWDSNQNTKKTNF